MNRLRVLHLNVGKRPVVQQSLLNDDSLKDFDALTVVEPYIFRHPQTGVPTITPDRRWEVFSPTTMRADGHARHAFRAAIWVNTRCKATQIPADSYDVAAVLLHLKERKLLLIACYEARAADTEAIREQDLRAMIQTLELTIKKAQREVGVVQLEILICADFNRYHVLWGGYNPIRARERRGEGDKIVDFIQETGLYSLLPAGTITWEHQSMDISSTVDLILGSRAIQEELVYCRIHSPDHGSDHKAIEIEIDTGSSIEPLVRGKRMYKDADWDRIRRKILDRIGDGSVLSRVTDPHLLDFAATSFTSQVDAVLEKEVPRAKGSPYAKRWWTQELSMLRDDFTRKRNRITILRRRGDESREARQAAHTARRIYHDELDRQKKQHWKDFLNDPANI
jgi:hypothetical protein